MSSGLRDLRIWQDSVALAGDVIRILRQSFRRETAAVTDAVMMTALAIGSHIADGYARHSPTEQRESYMLAKRALFRFETELAIARHADLIPAGSLTELVARCGMVSKMLTGYLAYLDRQMAERDEGHRAPATPGSAHAPS